MIRYRKRRAPNVQARESQAMIELTNTVAQKQKASASKVALRGSLNRGRVLDTTSRRTREKKSRRGGSEGEDDALSDVGVRDEQVADAGPGGVDES